MPNIRSEQLWWGIAIGFLGPMVYYKIKTARASKS